MPTLYEVAIEPVAEDQDHADSQYLRRYKSFKPAERMALKLSRDPSVYEARVMAEDQDGGGADHMWYYQAGRLTFSG